MNKNCSKCMYFKHEKYCTHFKFNITSLYNAEICCKYSIHNNKLNKTITIDDRKVQCTNCSNLILGDYCRVSKESIRNVRKQIYCKDYEPRKTITPSPEALHCNNSPNMDPLITEPVVKNKRQKKSQSLPKKCANCNNLFFESYCKKQLKNISNIYLTQNCNTYSPK